MLPEFLKKLFSLYNSSSPDTDAETILSGFSVNYGLTVFDSLLCIEKKGKKRIFRLEDHLNRFYSSLHELKISPDIRKREARNKMTETVSGLNGSCYIRILAYSNRKFWKFSDQGLPSSMHIHVMGVSFSSSRFFSKMKNPLKAELAFPLFSPVCHKISARYAMAALTAVSKSRHELIFKDKDGSITETGKANIFIVKDSRLYTPPADGKIVPGVTRDTVFALSSRLGIEAEEKHIFPGDLYRADEIFLTGTGTGIVNLSSVNGHPLRKKGVSDNLRSLYKKLLESEPGGKEGWITEINNEAATEN